MSKAVDKPSDLCWPSCLRSLLLLQYHPVFVSIAISRGVNNISNHFLVEVGVVKVVWVRSIRHVDTFLQGAYLTYFPSSS